MIRHPFSATILTEDVRTFWFVLIIKHAGSKSSDTPASIVMHFAITNAIIERLSIGLCWI